MAEPKREIRYVGGPHNGRTDEYVWPYPLGVTVATATEQIRAGQAVTAPQIANGSRYRLDEADGPVYVYEGPA